jgi:hypothetical protein
MINAAGSVIRKAMALSCAILFPVSLSLAQQPTGPATPATQQAAPLLSPDQVNNIVAPIALYPDPLLGQVLAASTYPLEIAEAGQWLQKNGNLSGEQLIDAAKQQNWDPSVQALVAFPDALRLLSNDIRWTTDLGNAFLSQQSDVMSAVQGMRARAQANGRLATTPQQVVTTDNQGDQSAIEIQPANPQVIYVPVYNPAYVWGPPAWGAYPDLWYPDGFGFGFGFGPSIYIGSFFPSWGGWGGWGWGCGWFGNGLFVNTGFFNRYGFRGGFGGGFAGRGFGGRGAWAHDPGHRMGVPYPNRSVAGRFNSTRFSGNGGGGRQFSSINRGNTSQNRSNTSQNRSNIGQNRSNIGQNRGNTSQAIGGRSNAGAGAGGSRTFNGYNRAANSNARQASPNFSRGTSQAYRAPAQSYRNSPAYNRSSAYSAARGQSYSAPRSYSSPSPNFAASPNRSFSGGRSFSAPRSSGGSFSGGHSGSSGGSRSGGGGRRR